MIIFLMRDITLFSPLKILQIQTSLRGLQNLDIKMRIIGGNVTKFRENTYIVTWASKRRRDYKKQQDSKCFSDISTN